MKKPVLIFLMVLLAALMALPVSASIGVGGDAATIHVTSSPSGAEVYDSGAYVGRTPVDITVYTTATPMVHDITVSMSGYYSYHTTVPSSLSSGEYYQVHASLTPIHQVGYVNIQSSPAGANVYLDGSYQGTTPITVTADTGSHSVRLERSNYETWYGSVSVSADQTSYLSPVLSPVADYAYINVQSRPSGAAIYINGNYRDTTSSTVTVSPGTHTVRVVLSGYDPFTQTVTVSSGNTAYISTDLSSSTANSYLDVASTPAGASVYLDNSYMGVTGYSSASVPNYMVIGPLSAGTYSLMVKKDGYNTYTSSISLSSNEVRKLTVSLTPSSGIPSGVAALNLDSEPSGAEVYVDNVFRGYTPIYLSDIAPGQRTLLIQLAGYNDWTQYVTFTDGQTVSLDAPLSTKIPPAPTESPFPVLAIAGLLGAAILLRKL